MKNLTEIEASVTELSKDDYIKFREWFWEYENEVWDRKIEKDVKSNKLSSLAEKALTDFAAGNFKKL